MKYYFVANSTNFDYKNDSLQDQSTQTGIDLWDEIAKKNRN